MRWAPLLLLPLLAACQSPSLQGIFGTGPGAVEAAAAAAAGPRPQTLDPTPPPPPPASATTAAEFDTTSEEDRAAAQGAASGGETRLGTTLATLGNPAEPGIWIATPLVQAVTAGRVETAGGEAINLELRPSGGAVGSGSEISLPAMQLLGLPLTAIEELTVLPPVRASAAGGPAPRAPRSIYGQDEGRVAGRGQAVAARRPSTRSARALTDCRGSGTGWYPSAGRAAAIRSNSATASASPWRRASSRAKSSGHGGARNTSGS